MGVIRRHGGDDGCSGKISSFIVFTNLFIPILIHSMLIFAQFSQRFVLHSTYMRHRNGKFLVLGILSSFMFVRDALDARLVPVSYLSRAFLPVPVLVQYCYRSPVSILISVKYYVIDYMR